MTTHTIPADADLITLVQLNKQWEIEDALLRRRANRERNRQRSLKSARTRRSKEREGATQFHKGESNEHLQDRRA